MSGEDEKMFACECGKTLKDEQGLMFHQRYKHAQGGKGSRTNPAVTKSYSQKDSRITRKTPQSGRAHDIRDSKLGYLLCVLCGGKEATKEEFAKFKCESLAEAYDRIAKEMEREIKEAGSKEAWLTKQSNYVRGLLDWHDTVPDEEQRALGWK